MAKQYPRIYLAIDNCFAKKRWTTPETWAKVIAGLGIHYIEASADTELDPLYMGKDYLNDWLSAVRCAEEKYGVKVCNLYSGHGSYTTLGLAHTDARVRRHILEHWFQPLIDIAASLDAGFGFYAHAFPEQVMQDAEIYGQYCEILLNGLAELNQYAKEKNCHYLSLEQMYSPNQIPWTIPGTKYFVEEVTKRSGKPFYFTEDLGHHHTKFRMPSRQSILDAYSRKDTQLWLGCEAASALYQDALATGTFSDEICDKILRLVQENDRFFAAEADSDCYEWLRQIGCYAPIIHLQQTDGYTSSHKPFSETNNRAGKIHGQQVLTALKESYDHTPENKELPKCTDVYFTLELFAGTAQTSQSILSDCADSVSYWRQFIPQDGMYLDDLVKRSEKQLAFHT